MFRLILIFLLFILPGSLCAQSYKDSIRVQFSRYTDLFFKKEYAKSAEYINPNLFKFIPKAKFIAAMEEAFKIPDWDMSLDTSVITSIGDITTIDGDNFVQLQYAANLALRVKNDSETVVDADLVIEELQEQYGDDNVAYNASTDTYTVVSVVKVIANSVNKRKWTFISVDQIANPLLQKIIPKELYMKLRQSGYL